MTKSSTFHINILSRPHDNIFQAQWNQAAFPTSAFDIQYNSSADIEWDMVVVYENTNEAIDIKCKSGNLLYFSGEPPLMHPLPNKYLRQFDRVILPHRHVRHPGKMLSHGFLNWSLGRCGDGSQQYDYQALADLHVRKTKNISMIVSTKGFMPGHKKRMNVLSRLQQDFPHDIDFYGRGIHPIDCKSEGLLEYRFHICMENCSIPYYWTEKFADPVLAYSVPIYCGCTNISQLFPQKGYIPFSNYNYDELKAIIVSILENPDQCYQNYYDGLCEIRKTLMCKENIIPFLIDQCSQKPGGQVRTYHIEPLVCGYNSVPFLLTKAKRFLATYNINL